MGESDNNNEYFTQRQLVSIELVKLCFTYAKFGRNFLSFFFSVFKKTSPNGKVGVIRFALADRNLIIRKTEF